MKRSHFGIPRLQLQGPSRPINSGTSREAPPPFSEGSAADAQSRRTVAKSTPPQEVAARRADAPLVLEYRTGSRSQALLAVSTPEQRDLSLLTFDSRAVVKSTAKSRNDRLDLWNAMADKAGFKGPLTYEYVRTIVGGLLRAGYRSAHAYFSAAKRQHIMTFKTWDAELDYIVAAEVSRACQRGQGPSAKASPFPLLEVAKTMDTNAQSFADLPVHVSGPLHPFNCSVLATWALFREIEAANASVDDVRLCKANKTISITASASKTDPSAMGATVTLTCVCHLGLATVCPYCVGRAHLALIIVYYGIETKEQQHDQPLFPSTAGTRCTKAGMIHAISTMATAAGQTARTRRGADKWGGHAWRRGGVHLMASLGLSRTQIKEAARHSSNAVDGYLEGADLQYVRRLLPSFLGPSSGLAIATSPLAATSSFPAWTKVKMVRNGKVHQCSPSEGRTLCGWPWSASVSRCVSADTDTVDCVKCILRAAQAPRIAASSSSSSAAASRSVASSSSGSESSAS